MDIPAPLRLPYALLVMAVCSLVALESAAASDPTYRGRSYRLVWPDHAEATTGVFVFLHGLSPRPFREEADAIATMSKLATERGMVAVFPRARKLCSGGKQRCWSLKDVNEELTYLDALVEHVEGQRKTAFGERHIVGFSHGGFLLGGAVEQGLLADYERVGILAGGPLGKPPETKPERAPPLFLEVGSEDRTQWSSMHELFQRLTSFPSELYFREVSGGHAIDGARATSFLRWFWANSPTTKDIQETPRAPSPVPSPVR